MSGTERIPVFHGGEEVNVNGLNFSRDAAVLGRTDGEPRLEWWSRSGPCGQLPDRSVQVGVRLLLPELLMPQGDCPTAARRPDGPALTSGECPAARQQEALAMRTRSTSRRRTKNTPWAGMV